MEAKLMFPCTMMDSTMMGYQILFFFCCFFFFLNLKKILKNQFANDGIYGASIKASQAGQYMATAVIEGVTPNGATFIRSTEHVINVVDDPIELTGNGV